jgi:hypothetical protein
MCGKNRMDALDGMDLPDGMDTTSNPKAALRERVRMPEKETLIPKHGGYRKLKSFQVRVNLCRGLRAIKLKQL